MIVYLSEDLKKYNWNKPKEISKTLTFKLINNFNDEFIKYELGIAITTIFLKQKRGIYIFFDPANSEDFEDSNISQYIENNAESFYLGLDSFVLGDNTLNINENNIYDVKFNAIDGNFHPNNTYLHLDYQILGHHFNEYKKYDEYIDYVNLFQFFLKNNKMGIDEQDYKKIKYELKNNIFYAKKHNMEIDSNIVKYIKDFYSKHHDELFRIMVNSEKFNHMLDY